MLERLSFLSTETASWISPDSLKMNSLAKSDLGGSSKRDEVSSCGEIHLLRTAAYFQGYKGSVYSLPPLLCRVGFGVNACPLQANPTL